MYVIKDRRTGKVYIDSSSLLEEFEEELESNISYERAIEKYPTAINLTQKPTATK